MSRDASSCRTLWGTVLFELRKSPPLLAGMTLGTVGYSVGHAALAFGAGSLAAALSGAPSAWADDFLGPVMTPAYVGLGGAIVKASGGTVLTHAERTLAARGATEIRLRTLEKLLESGGRVPPPKVLAALVVRLREVELAILDGHLAAVRSWAQLVPLATCLVALAPVAAALALGVAVLFVALSSRLRRSARRTAGDAQTLAEELECGVDELVRNTDLFRTYGAGASVLSGVESLSRNAGAAAARQDSQRAALSGMNEVVGAFAVTLVLALFEKSALSAATLLPFAALSFMGYRPLRDLGDARGFILRGNLALAATVAVTESERSSPAPAVSRGVRVVASAFAIRLDGFGARLRGPRTTFDVRPGEILCVAGPTGSGKTTLLRTMLGLEEPVGRIAFEGRDVTDLPTGPEHRPFAWVPQEAPLVTATLSGNVMLTGGDETASRAALGAIGATSVLAIAESETIGPGGRPLSGGERRLVSLARAVSSGLPVLLLDEPTEGLDPASAANVMGAIAALRGTRTMVVVTHREELQALADRVVRIGEGRQLSDRLHRAL